jgi:hypothetical protein
MSADNLVAQQEGVVLLSQRLGFVFWQEDIMDLARYLAIESYCGLKTFTFSIISIPRLF